MKPKLDLLAKAKALPRARRSWTDDIPPDIRTEFDRVIESFNAGELDEQFGAHGKGKLASFLKRECGLKVCEKRIVEYITGAANGTP
jgi:hypothetical protein